MAKMRKNTQQTVRRRGRPTDQTSKKQLTRTDAGKGGGSAHTSQTVTVQTETTSSCLASSRRRQCFFFLSRFPTCMFLERHACSRGFGEADFCGSSKSGGNPKLNSASFGHGLRSIRCCGPAKKRLQRGPNIRAGNLDAKFDRLKPFLFRQAPKV